MERESQPLMEEKSELEDFASVYHLNRGSRRRSWIKDIATHALVMISTVLVIIIFNVQGVILLPNLWGNKAQPSIYCKYSPRH